MKAKSQLEQDTIVNDIAALEAQLHTKQQQLRSMASQPPGPSQGKQRHPPHHRCHLPHPCPHSHPLVIVVVVSPVPVPVPIPLSLLSLSPLSLSLSPSPSPHHRRCVTVVPVSLSFLCHCRSCVTVIPVSLSFLCHCRSCVIVHPGVVVPCRRCHVVLAFARPILLSLSSWCWHGRTAMLLLLCWHGRAAIVVVVILLWHLPWASCHCHLHHVGVNTLLCMSC